MRTKLLVIIPSLFIGGSEQVIVRLVKNLDRKKFDLSLLVLNSKGDLIEEIPSDINVVKLNHSRTALAIFSIATFIRKIKPHLVLSTLGHLNLLIALLRPLLPSKVKFLARESSIVSIRNKDERYPRLFNFLFKNVYNQFDRVICQSQFMKRDLIENFRFDSKKIKVINNPIDFSLIPAIRKIERPSFIRLLSVGNLRPEKGYDRLLTALAKASFDYRYEIVGGGDAEPLNNLVTKYQLQGKVNLAGKLRNPFPYYLNADCLLVGSYYEGFPNVVIEAQACGLPVIAFSAPGGHNEIIVNGINGWFVNSDLELLSLISERAFEKLDKENIIALTKQKYELKRIMQEYEECLIEAAL